jgi:pimeloyl-ACP methyl ester carboxylesterase
MPTILSKDGTPIECQCSGQGAPLVVIHGTGSDTRRWTAFPALAEHFSVYAMDRRGRRESGDGASYAIEREFEDVAAVVDSIGEQVNVLGHSFGGLCALEAALLTPHIRRLVLYEPDAPVEGSPSVATGVLERLEALLEAGQPEDVYTAFLQEVVQLPPDEVELMRSSPAWPARVAEAHTLPRELRALEQYRFEAERFSGLATPTLLLEGGDSPGDLKAGVARVNAALATSRVVALAGQQHLAMYTAPELFVREVAAFLN